MKKQILISAAILALCLTSQGFAAPDSLRQPLKQLPPNRQISSQAMKNLANSISGPVITKADPNLAITYSPQSFEITSSGQYGMFAGNNRLDMIVSWRSPNPNCEAQRAPMVGTIYTYAKPAAATYAISPIRTTSAGVSNTMYCSFANVSIPQVEIFNKNDVQSACSTTPRGTNVIVKQQVQTSLENRPGEIAVFDVLVHCP